MTGLGNQKAKDCLGSELSSKDISYVSTSVFIG